MKKFAQVDISTCDPRTVVLLLESPELGITCKACEALHKHAEKCTSGNTPCFANTHLSHTLPNMLRCLHTLTNCAIVPNCSGAELHRAERVGCCSTSREAAFLSRQTRSRLCSVVHGYNGGNTTGAPGSPKDCLHTTLIGSSQTRRFLSSLLLPSKMCQEFFPLSLPPCDWQKNWLLKNEPPMLLLGWQVCRTVTSSPHSTFPSILNPLPPSPLPPYFPHPLASSPTLPYFKLLSLILRNSHWLPSSTEEYSFKIELQKHSAHKPLLQLLQSPDPDVQVCTRPSASPLGLILPFPSPPSPSPPLPLPPSVIL